MGIQYWLSTENQVAWHTVGNELVECETVNHLAPLYEYRRRQRVNYVCVHPSAYAALRSFAALRACVWVPPDIISLVQYTRLTAWMLPDRCDLRRKIGWCSCGRLRRLRDWWLTVIGRRRRYLASRHWASFISACLVCSSPRAAQRCGRCDALRCGRSKLQPCSCLPACITQLHNGHDNARDLIVLAGLFLHHRRRRGVALHSMNGDIASRPKWEAATFDCL